MLLIQHTTVKHSLLVPKECVMSQCDTGARKSRAPAEQFTHHDDWPAVAARMYQQMLSQKQMA